MFIVMVSLPVHDVINFGIYINFLSSRFPTEPKSNNKNVNIFRTKRTFKIIFQGLLLKQIKRTFVAVESPSYKNHNYRIQAKDRKTRVSNMMFFFSKYGKYNVLRFAAVCESKMFLPSAPNVR